MLAPFERTLRALAAERRRRPVGLVVALLVIAAWGAWAALAKVSVHVTSVAGRIESKAPVQVLRAEVDGRLVAVHPTIGEVVEVGDLLFELDDAEPEIHRAEAVARAGALQAERDVISAAIDAANAAKESGQDVLAAALGEARAKTTRARLAVTQADRELGRLKSLGADAVASQDLERAKNETALRRAEAAAADALAARLSAEEKRDASDRTATVERMRQDLVRLDAEQAKVDADRRAAEVATDRRRIRAPVSGRLGELQTLRPGDYVAAGQALATVVPSGELRVVARFSAERALGWIRVGAPARLRLDAFPWTWFGEVAATVREVALEPKDGLLEVELALASVPADIPLGHGLTGEVEVEVEETTPLALFLRAAGGQSARQATEPAP